ncbi:MAG TPA: dihydroorotate dehydrogenase electron transfer subunit [Acidobacteriota bacterium]|nr:dihydroorotate dehydrogenase electron transfer subunit [Acidobacteriota bacterium]
MLDKNVRVKEIQDLGAGNYLLTLRSPEQARLVRPGQFVMLKCVEGLNEPPLLRRPFSVFDTLLQPRTGRPAGLVILVKDVGTGSHKLSQLRPGDAIGSLGPQGRPFQISAGMKNRLGMACLVAGGVGIAALYLLARDLIAQNVRPLLFYGGRTAADLVLRECFERLGIETHYTTEDGSLGERGIVTVPLEEFLRGHRRSDLRLYACGPWGMMKATHQAALRHGITCEVSLEARMGCSLGACMGCVIHGWDQNGEEQYLRVCQEGPIMNSRTVDWETSPF